MPLAQTTINNSAYRSGIILSSVSFVMSTYFSVFDFLPRLNDVHNTPFTSISAFIIIFWAAFTLFHFVFLIKVTRDQIAIPSNTFLTHIIMFNVLHLTWVLLFLRRYYIIAEIIILVNFINMFAFYVRERSYRTTTGLLYVHLPLSSFPFAWLFYAILWNGFLMFTSRHDHGHDHKNEFSLLARILSNIFIFEYLFGPFMFLTLYKDWTFGLLLSFLVYGIGIDQVMVKLIALQWILAFVIASIVLLLSIVIMYSQLTGKNINAPLMRAGESGNESIQRGSETEPLLA